MIDVKPWGKSISINLFGCKLEFISNPEIIKEFISQLIKVIDMKAHGPVYIERFGEGKLEGYSAMQFIETSSITVHCDEPDQRCFVDIFSCKDFDSLVAEKFSQKYFQAQSSTSTTLIR